MEGTQLAVLTSRCCFSAVVVAAVVAAAAVVATGASSAAFEASRASVAAAVAVLSTAGSRLGSVVDVERLALAVWTETDGVYIAAVVFGVVEGGCEA